ncbi:hypothetical protein BCV70DRAFT_200729 [Testicularia cyperi]|uniref:lipoyl(octanoyl) transferase n=1 Tax=Testicularia cyperi TaxID=1882483 RepID=A0A317XR47_9BASI|nr:hypothetical protein BCV70DRAFT_200729 [Testicularia cyperi]
MASRATLGNLVKPVSRATLSTSAVTSAPALNNADGYRVGRLRPAGPKPTLQLSVEDIVHAALGSAHRGKGFLQPWARQSRTASEFEQHVALAMRMVAAVHHVQQGHAPLRIPVPHRYEARAHLIVRMIRLNRILSAMTALQADVVNPLRKPFTLQQLEAFMRVLHRQCKTYGSHRPATVKPLDQAGNLWRPWRLDPAIDARTLPIPVQGVYAMAAIYDICIHLRYTPTAKMISAMLSTFVSHLPQQQLLLAAQNALRDQLSEDPVLAAKRLRRINHSALATFLFVFGNAGSPAAGEELLDRWAKAQLPNASDLGLPSDRTGNICATGWVQNELLWDALVQSRIAAGDMQGARAWLDRYHLVLEEISKSPDGCPFQKASAPYLTFISGLSATVDPAEVSEKASLVVEEIRRIVRQMMQEGIKFDNVLLAFVLDFETRAGNVDRSLSLLKRLGEAAISSSDPDPAIMRSLFRLRAALAGDDNAPNSASRHLSDSKASEIRGLPDTRALLSTLVNAEEKSTQRGADHAELRSRGMLNEALAAAVEERDYPAAVVVLNLFERWRLQPSHVTYSIVLTALARHGHHQALKSASQDVFTESCPVAVVDELLSDLARKGKLEQAESLRRVVQETSAFSSQLHDTVSVSAHPPATMPVQPLRKTQYLVRTLNAACDIELQRALEPHGSTPSWAAEALAQRRFGSDHDTVRRVILATQEAILGPKTSDSVHQGSSRPSGMFKSTRNLSPRRQDFRSSSVKFGRSFSSSAKNRESMSSPSSSSCSLTPSGDFTTLEPVRVQYLPGFVPYTLGLALQEHLVKQRADARAALRALDKASSASAGTQSGHHSVAPSAQEAALRKTAEQDTLLLLQHRPVYTEGRREENENELVSKHLRSLGAEYALTKRGGQITYHGPGQLVGYPILNLASMGLASRCYVDRVQDTLIAMLAEQGLETVPPPDDHTGVWADEYHKIASIGIQVRHRISSHGFALNVEQRAMRGFRHIVACGIHGRSMTCIADRIASSSSPNAPMTVADAADRVTQHFASTFGRRVREATEEEFQFELAVEDAALLEKGLGIPINSGEKVVTGIRVDGHPVVV